MRTRLPWGLYRPVRPDRPKLAVVPQGRRHQRQWQRCIAQQPLQALRPGFAVRALRRLRAGILLGRCSCCGCRRRQQVTLVRIGSLATICGYTTGASPSNRTLGLEHRCGLRSSWSPGHQVNTLFRRGNLLPSIRFCCALPACCSDGLQGTARRGSCMCGHGWLGHVLRHLAARAWRTTCRTQSNRGEQLGRTMTLAVALETTVRGAFYNYF